MRQWIVPLLVSGVGVVALLFVGYTVVFITPLPKVPVPKKAELFLPNPLVFAPLSNAVLGAQVIDGSEIISYVNIERKKKSVRPLRESIILRKAALMRAEVIGKYQNFSHQDPYESVELLTVLPRLNYFFRYASENIGMGGVSAQDFVGGFMNSTSHRENLLNPALLETGVAVVSGPYQQYYVNIAVQIFAIPATKEEYLGYSSQDIVYYQKLLTDINDKLVFTRYFLEKGWGNQTYYQGWEMLLLRQKDIISGLFTHMKSQKPLDGVQIKLIHEYNSNWQEAPKI